MVNIYDLNTNKIEPIIFEILKTFETSVNKKVVLIKPNLLGAYDPEHGATTHPEVVKHIYQQLKMLGANPIGGDSPGGTVTDFEFAASISGLKQACEENFVSLTREVTEVNLPANKKIPSIFISQLYKNAPFIINVPKMKTHTLTTITGAIKNLYGIIPGSLKLRLHSEASSIKEFSSLLVDIYQIRPPDINIMEAITAMEGDGPAHGSIRKTNLILYSTNAIELDAIAAYMMGINPRNVHHLRIANQRGLGEINPEKIKVIGNLFRIPSFKPPSTYKTFLERALNRFANIIALTPNINTKICTKCGDCIKNCPKNAINMKEYPLINRADCISCFVCAECCPVGAIYLPKSIKGEFNARIKRRLRLK
ncbi:MAG: Ferredoxin [candidate division WS2 bacterium]|nr:Ferredoxin [Candidatus Lithacetigena glycinireducens]